MLDHWRGGDREQDLMRGGWEVGDSLEEDQEHHHPEVK